MIEIRIVLVFQRELKTIEESRMLLIKYTKIDNSLKHLTMLEIVIINFLQCTNKFIN